MKPTIMGRVATVVTAVDATLPCSRNRLGVLFERRDPIVYIDTSKLTRPSSRQDGYCTLHAQDRAVSDESRARSKISKPDCTSSPVSIKATQRPRGGRK